MVGEGGAQAWEGALETAGAMALSPCAAWTPLNMPLSPCEGFPCAAWNPPHYAQKCPSRRLWTEDHAPKL